MQINRFLDFFKDNGEQYHKERLPLYFEENITVLGQS